MMQSGPATWRNEQLDTLHSLGTLRRTRRTSCWATTTYVRSMREGSPPTLPAHRSYGVVMVFPSDNGNFW